VTLERRALGADGEQLAAEWYEAAGYRVLDRNWRCSSGELDLVVARRDTLVFAEVKTRRGIAYGAPYEAVTFDKQRRLRRLAVAWLHAHDRHRGALRFDVVSVSAPRGQVPTVEVIEAAF
jgi:putative endonuclease